MGLRMPSHLRFKRFRALLAAGGLAVLLLMAIAEIRSFGTNRNDVPSGKRALARDAMTAGAIGAAYDFELIGGREQDWGQLRKDERRTHFLRFVNRGNAPVNVVRVARSCGCLNAVVVSPRTIQPNQTGVIRVDVSGDPVSAGKRTYAVSATLQETDDICWTITFRTVSDIYAQPPSVWVSEVQPEEVTKGRLFLSHRLGDGLKIRGCLSRSGHVKATGFAPESGGLWCDYALAALPPGQYDDELIIRTNSKMDPEVAVPFKWQVISDVRVSPPYIHLPAGQGHETDEQVTFWVESRSQDCFVVSKLEYDTSVLRIKPISAGDEERWRYGYTVTRAGTAGSEGVSRELVEIHTSECVILLLVFG